MGLADTTAAELVAQGEIVDQGVSQRGSSSWSALGC